VIMRTPVDTGRARGNWHASVSKPINSETSDLDKSAPVNQTGGGSSSAKAKATSAVLGGEAGSEFWLTNNLPYIQELENGSSKQTDHQSGGMVGKSVAEFKNVFKGAVEKAKKS